jgi:hypothetical protein
VIENDAEKYKKVVWLDALSGDKLTDSILWDGKFADGTKAGIGDYFITLKISDATGNETMKSAVVNVTFLNSLLPILPFTPPATTFTPAPQTEPTPSTFGGTTSEPTGEVTSSPSTAGGGNSESTGKVATSQSTTGGTRAEGKPVTAQTFSHPPVTSAFPIPTSAILWGAASAAAVGYFLSEAQKRKEEEEQKQAEARRALDAAHAAEQAALEPLNAELRRQEEEERIEREERTRGKRSGFAHPDSATTLASDMGRKWGAAVRGKTGGAEGGQDCPCCREECRIYCCVLCKKGGNDGEESRV